MRWRVGLVLVVLAGSACGEAFSGAADDAKGGSAGSGGDLSQTPCTPGRSLPCVGKGQCDGFQECNAKGTGYGSCQCEDAAGGASVSGGASSSASGGSAASDGGDPSNPGMAGASAEPVERYVYWTGANSALIQTLDGQTGEVTGEKALTGPEAMATTGWTMRTFVPFSDGTAKALWTTAEGTAELWTLGSNLAPVTTVAFVHAPPAAYFASSYRRLADGSGRLVWHENATSNSYVWPLSEQGAFLEQVLGYEPTPEGDWLPVHYTTMPDGRGLLLWVGVETGVGPTGESQAWIMPDDSQPTAVVHIQHSQEQWTRALTQDADGTVRLSLGSKVDGAGVVCGLLELAAEVVTVPTAAGWGPGKCKSYTRAGMQFRGYVARWQPSISDP